MPADPLHQCNEKNLAHMLFALFANMSIVWGPLLASKRLKNHLANDQFSGMSILEMSSAKAFCSLGTHSTDVLIRCLRHN